MLKKLTNKLKSSAGSEAGAKKQGHRRFHRNKPVVREEMGKWIWLPTSDEVYNSYVYFRKHLELKAKPTKAIINAASDTRYKLYVNGNYVGKGPVRSCSGYTYYDTFDIAQYLNKGKNVIAFHAVHIGERTNFAPLKKPGLICRAEIEVGEHTELVVTDETWKVHAADEWTNLGGRISDALGFQEVYDSALRLDGWNEVKFREKAWEDAVVVGVVPSMPWGQLVEREVPPLDEEKVYPREIVGLFNSPERAVDTPPSEVPIIMADSELVPLKNGKISHPDALLSADGETKIGTPRSDMGLVVVLDFGREVFGNVEIGIAGSASGTIDIGYSEILEDGRVKPDRGGMRYTDRIILKKGKLDWQGFETRAFRYMQIEFRKCSRTVALEYVRVNETTFPVKAIGRFECSDQLLNDIWRTAAYTAHVCMEDTFIDCPWRERAMWWGDARIQSRAVYYAFDDTLLLAQGLRQLASQQNEEGAILGMYPGETDKMVPDFSLSWLFSLLDYYAFADDAGLLRELYPNVERLLAHFGRYVTAEGLLGEVPGWLFIDWAEIDKRGEVTALNCLYYHGLRVAAVIASICDRAEDAERYMEMSIKLRLAINKYLYSPRDGMYADCRVKGLLADSFSPQTNILAALFDVADQYKKASILRSMVGKSLDKLDTPYIVSSLVEALCAADRYVDALHVIRKKWGECVKSGAATFPEFFSADGSRCHGWSTGPIRDLIAEFVGIKPVIGSHRFSVTPRMADLKWARGSINTKVGLLTVDWKIIRGALSIGVEVPQGIKVDVYPPCPDDCRITVDGKAHEARFVTLSGGSHVVRVAAIRAARPRRVDKSLEPPPMPHVEVLGDLMTRGRRRLALTDRRSKGKRVKDALAEIGTADLLTEEIAEETAVQTQPEAAVEEASTPKRKRTRRGGKGRTKSAAAEISETASAVPEALSEAEEPTTEIASEAIPSEEIAEVETRSKRRRSRRGGRGRNGRKAAEQAETVETAKADEAVESVEEAPAEAEAVAEVSAVEEEPRRTRSRRGRRGGRGRSRGTKASETTEVAEAADVTEIAAEPVTDIQPVGEAETLELLHSEEEPHKTRSRRGRRGGRGRSRGAKATETTEVAEAADVTQVIEEAPVEPAGEAENVERLQATEEEPKKSRSRRGRRGGRGRSKGAVATEVPETAEVAAVVETTKPANEAADAAETPVQEEESSRSRSRRGRRGGRGRSRGAKTTEAAEPAETHEAAEHAEPISEPEAVENAPASEEPQKSRNKRGRRGGRGRSKATEVPDVVQTEVIADAPESPQSEAIQEASAEPQVKKTRRGGRGRNHKKPAVESSSDQPIISPEGTADISAPSEAAPAKPTRRSRRSKAVGSAESGEPASAEPKASEKSVAAAPEASEEAKPKRTRRTSRKAAKPAEEGVREAEKPVSESSEEAETKPKRRRTTTRKPKAKPENAEE